MAVSAIGLDLGTYNIKLYNGIDDTIHTHKNMIAIQNKHHVLAYGDEAFKMYEKTPESIEISFPVTNGVIADIHHMQLLTL